jgi:Protein of unknown function (DUF3592)
VLRHRMAAWPRTIGVVRAASVHRLRRRNHRPRFVVDYSFQGTAYTSTCESPTRSGFTNSPGAYGQLSRYPVGAEVSLYIAPDSPARAFLWLPELQMLPAFFVGGALLLLTSISGGLSALSIDPIEWLSR